MRRRTFIFLYGVFFSAALLPTFGEGREEEIGTEPGAALESPQAPELTAEQLYRSAFDRAVTPEERRAILKEVFKKHRSSRWAEDALWALGRLAEIEGRGAVAVLWYRRLMEEFSHPVLESFTEGLQLYRTSSLPRILHVADAAGVRYMYDRGQLLTFNPLPYAVHKHLGSAYQQLGYYGLAEREYRKAYENLPEIGLLRNAIQVRIDMLQRMQGTASSQHVGQRKQ